MRGRFAVGDHDDLLRPVLLGEQLSGQHESVLHVGSVHKVPRHRGNLRRGEDARRLAETDKTDVIARVLRGDERMERHRHLLGRQEVVTHRHRHRQVNHQNG